VQFKDVYKVLTHLLASLGVVMLTTRRPSSQITAEAERCFTGTPLKRTGVCIAVVKPTGPGKKVPTGVDKRWR
jgi:hypothetical protein